MMKKIFIMFIALTIFIFAGCVKKVSGDEKTAEEYIKAQGYKITSYNGEVQRYTLDNSKLYGATHTIPYQQVWGLQKVEPDKYFGKEIVVYGFAVKNHPLQSRDEHAKNGVKLFIMLSEGKVIGGSSLPDTGEVLLGGSCYSLDGKTLEEVTGLSFTQWSESWKKKYEKLPAAENLEKPNSSNLEESETLPLYYTWDLALKNGDVVEVGDKFYNLEKLEKFLEAFKDRKTYESDRIRITWYTKEGDACINELIVTNEGVKLITDNTRDKWTSEVRRKRAEHKVVDFYTENIFDGAGYTVVTVTGEKILLIVVAD
jgi:hypothetical protein